MTLLAARETVCACLTFFKTKLTAVDTDITACV